jgi:hypothetical protein
MKKAPALGVVLAIAVCAPREAAAMGAVVTTAGETVSIAREREAVSVANGYTTRWAQISTTPSASGFGWLVPLAPGARVDLADDAWLDALDAATSPVVVAPTGAAPCPVSTTPDVLPPGTSPLSLIPAQVGLARNLASLDSITTTAGWVITADVAKELQQVFAGGDSVLVLGYGASSLPTRTLRIVDTAPASIGLPLGGSNAGAIVTAFVLGGSAVAPSAPVVTIPSSEVLWLTGGESSYAADIASALTPGAWLLEVDEASSFFVPTAVPSSAPLPSVLSSYYSLARAYGETAMSPESCLASAESLAGAAPSFSSLCAPGALAVVPGLGPCIAPQPADTPAMDLVCGTAIDAALAVGTLLPEGVWVSRMTAIVTNAVVSDVPLVTSPAAPSSPVLVASGYALTCVEGALDGGVWDASFDADFDDGGFDDGGFVPNPESPSGYADDGGGLDWDGGGGGFDWEAGVGGGGSVDSTSVDITSPAASDDDTDDVGGCSGSTDDDTESGGCSGDSSSDSSDGGCSGDDTNNSCAIHGTSHRRRSPLPGLALLVTVGLAVMRRRARRSRADARYEPSPFEVTPCASSGAECPPARAIPTRAPQPTA